jgi:glyoxylase-like metal-dependent hydrolase (beta-lactamase superfamily II)
LTAWLLGSGAGGVERIDIVLTHFHLDHVCGRAYVPALPVRAALWAPARSAH